MVEHFHGKEGVTGSSPVDGSTSKLLKLSISVILEANNLKKVIFYGQKKREA